ncbi:hypothetical protein AVEN_26797-1 [Araneus ventricosus]|uniref:Uncharacterized protein n=1 Tax=Araneus ventricosus TaxID=182803 RepID=A0A4Y2ETY5_ARAVE|nr:hypothetical protein AVEN_26797-1 [Araneus ventricosus]
MIWRAAGPIHGGSSVESSFGPATLRSLGRGLTTRPPRPLYKIAKKADCIKAVCRFIDSKFASRQRRPGGKTSPSGLECLRFETQFHQRIVLPGVC